MSDIAIIPLRANSKGIVKKNKRKLLGRPLFTWVLTEAIFSKLNKVYVYTDDNEILDYVRQYYSWSEKVIAKERSNESASDVASTEMAMLEFAEKIDYNFDTIMLLQATSPLTSRENINEALDKLAGGTYDSVLSVVSTKRFIWNKNGTSANYDYTNRPRRQDFDGLLIENGAIYISNKETFIQSENRLGGNIGFLEMDEDSLTEIDEPNDFIIIEDLLKNRLKKANKGFSKIRALCLDVDGVFTDATLTVSGEGEFSKTFSLRDGMGLNLLMESGVEVIVMTAEDSEIVARRMKKLGIADAYLNIKDKFSLLEYLLEEKEYGRENIAYIGDDINDMANILYCGLGLCPKDADASILNNADIVLTNDGGCRVIREACTFINKYNQRF